MRITRSEKALTSLTIKFNETPSDGVDRNNWSDGARISKGPNTNRPYDQNQTGRDYGHSLSHTLPASLGREIKSDHQLAIIDSS